MTNPDRQQDRFRHRQDPELSHELRFERGAAAFDIIDGLFRLVAGTADVVVANIEEGLSVTCSCKKSVNSWPWRAKS